MREALLRGAVLVAKAELALNRIFGTPDARTTVLEVGVQADDLKFNVHPNRISYHPPTSTDPDDEGAIEIQSPSGRIYQIEIGQAHEGPQIVALIARLSAQRETSLVLPKPYRVSTLRNHYGLGGVQVDFEGLTPHPLLAVIRAYQKRADAVLNFPLTTCRQVFAHH